jgi:polyisoprenoid-binding protein YceI
MIRLILALVLLATQSLAAPEAWRLDVARSTVGFTYEFIEGDNSGTMPVASTCATSPQARWR